MDNAESSTIRITSTFSDADSLILRTTLTPSQAHFLEHRILQHRIGQHLLELVVLLP